MTWVLLTCDTALHAPHTFTGVGQRRCNEWPQRVEGRRHIRANNLHDITQEQHRQLCVAHIGVRFFALVRVLGTEHHNSTRTTCSHPPTPRQRAITKFTHLAMNFT